MTAKTGKARFGFIGAGWWATTNHMPVLVERDDVEMTAVCRRGADELQQVKGRFGFEHATESFHELLEMVPVFVEKLEFESVGNRVDVPRHRVELVPKPRLILPRHEPCP